MRGYHLILSFFIISAINTEAHAQTLDSTKELTLSFQPILATTDPLDNLYFASNAGAIYKYDSEGDSLLRYEPIKTGKPTGISNLTGLKTLVFFENQQEFLFLDRFLIPSPRYQFPQGKIEYVVACTQSTDGNIWIVDQAQFTLFKFDPKSNVLMSETPLNFILPGNSYEITSIWEVHNLLYLVDNSGGVHIIDQLGNYVKEITIGSIDALSIFGNEIFVLKGSRIVVIDLKNGTEKQFDLTLPETEKQKSTILIAAKVGLYVLRGDVLSLFHLE